MFAGCFIHSVDEKSRICLPARFRKSLQDEFVLTKGPEGCLWALPRAQWDVVVKKAADSPSVQRFFVASACECSPGPKGRIALPVSLRLHSDIKPGQEVAIVGLKNRIEIWSLKRWEAANSHISTDEIRQALPEFFGG